MTDKRLPFNLAFKTALKNRTWPPDATGEQAQALEKHLQAVSRESSRVSSGLSFVIPTSALTRDLSVGVATAGGYLVGTEKPSLIDLLRPFSCIAAYSPTVLNDLTSDVSLPAVTVGTTTGWSAENAALTGVGDPVFALPVALSPHLVSATVKLSRKLIASTQFDFQAGVLRELYQALGASLDQAALLGTGTGNAPLGILNAPGVGALTFGGPATWPNILKFLTSVGKANAPKDHLAWLGSNNAAEKLRQAVKSTGSSNFVWQDGKIGDYRAEASSWLDATDQLIFGAWDNLIVGLWLDGISVLVDPFTASSTNEIKLTATCYMDVGLLRPALFAVSVDSAAQ
jgi:HK97 family phage major capsid protein